MAEPTNIDAIGIRRRLGATTWKPPMPFGPDGWKFINRNEASSIIVSCAPQDDGAEWVHASIAHTDRLLVPVLILAVERFLTVDGKYADAPGGSLPERAS